MLRQAELTGFTHAAAMPSVQAPAAPVATARTNGAKVARPPQPVFAPWLRAQERILSRHTAALRNFTREEFGSGAELPSDGHLLAVNQLLAKLRSGLYRAARRMQELTARTLQDPTASNLTALVTHKHAAHASVQRIEKIWDFYFELFGQRQSEYGCWLLSCDRIALDCYQSAYRGVGEEKSVPAPPPFSYMRTGFGPATYRRHIPMRALGREANPFPLIQIPYHRLVNPWTLGAVLHEVSHNLQSDLGTSRAVPRRIGQVLLRGGLGMDVARLWVRWNREMYADLNGLLLGGPAIVASLMDVVGRMPAIVYHFSPSGVHPTPYLRVLLSTELLRRMGFAEEAKQYAAVWRRLYANPQAGNFPRRILQTAPHAIALIVDAVCYQPYAELGGKRLCEVFRFQQKDQRMIEEAARRLAAGTDPGIVPERFLIGAARFALDNKLATGNAITTQFYKELARR